MRILVRSGKGGRLTMIDKDMLNVLIFIVGVLLGGAVFIGALVAVILVFAG